MESASPAHGCRLAHQAAALEGQRAGVVCRLVTLLKAWQASDVRQDPKSGGYSHPAAVGVEKSQQGGCFPRGFVFTPVVRELLNKLSRPHDVLAFNVLFPSQTEILQVLQHRTLCKVWVREFVFFKAEQFLQDLGRGIIEVSGEPQPSRFVRNKLDPFHEGYQSRVLNKNGVVQKELHKVRDVLVSKALLL